MTKVSFPTILVRVGEVERPSRSSDECKQSSLESDMGEGELSWTKTEGVKVSVPKDLQRVR